MTPFTICLGCGARATADDNRCARCAAITRAARPARRRDHDKPAEMRRVYDSRAWRRVRKAVLARAGGSCELCGADANVVDHQPPLRDQLAAGGSGLDSSLCRALCSSCSGRVDGARSRGGASRNEGALPAPRGHFARTETPRPRFSERAGAA